MSRQPDIILIAAMAKNRVIGKDSAIPWHISADLKRFKALTMGHPLIMGRKTHLSIAKPLPGRKNIVLTRDSGFQAAGCIVAHSPDEALKAVPAGETEVFIMGGEEIYKLFLTLADRMELTEVHAKPEGDAFFPQFNPVHWREVRRESHAAEGDTPAFDFVTLERKS